MGRVLFAIPAVSSRVIRAIALIQEFQRRGHEVVFAAGFPLTLLDELRLRTVRLPSYSTAPFVGFDGVDAGDFASAARADHAWLLRLRQRIYVDNVPTQVAGFRSVIQEVRPDLVVIDGVLHGAAIASQLESVRCVATLATLFSLRPDLYDEGDRLALETLRPALRESFTRHGLAAAFRGWEALGPDGTFLYTDRAVVGDVDLPPGAHLVGSSIAPATDAEPGVPFDLERLDVGGKPIVLIAFGTLAFREPALFRKVVDAARALGATVTMSRRSTEGLELTSRDEHVVPFDFLRRGDYYELLSRCAVCVSHAGSNGIAEALHHGVPMLLIPQWYGQPIEAHFVSDVARIGITLAPDADGLEDALAALLADRGYRGRADAIGATLRSQDGAAAVADRPELGPSFAAR